MLPRSSTGSTPTGSTKHAKQRDPGRLLARAVLLLWMPTVALGIGSLMVGHWAPMPTPSDAQEATLQAALRELVARDGAPRQAAPLAPASWKLVHVLYGDCGCSRGVAEYLLAPGRESSAEEWVLLIEGDSGGELHAELSAAGFRLHALTADDLRDRFGVESAPLFIAVDPQGDVRFVGGYTPRKQGLSYQDVATLDDLRAGLTPAPLPVFGCGVSNSLQSALDPLHLKY